MTDATDGQILAVVLDWAGTMLDHGSLAPLGVFRRAFARVGVDITDEEARGPMGLPKWNHIQAVGRLPRVAAAWEQVMGAPFTDADVDRLHALFLPLTLEAVAERATLIDGALDTLADLRRRGLKIGSTTGYDRPTMQALLPLAAAQGYSPDCLVTAGDLPQGRPSPLMMFKCFIDLAVWPAQAVVKVDDTPPGIGEGLAAGTWTVGVSATGNLMGLDAAATAALPPDEFAARNKAAAQVLSDAGAHYVIDSIRDLPAVLDDINRRLAAGERP
jgi:phosphonoacetaldehyde hydrolase